jgi:NAD(P)-dependent dehydrogenase (short-subunit alcohol dehydrogenase family)
MKNFTGKICFITGGASGAGLGQAKVFAKSGMKVAIADIRADALHAAVTEIIDYAGCATADVLPLCFDLTDRKAFATAADTVENVFGGAPHLFIQTAGVNSFGPVEASTYDDYDWVVGVCFDAVVNGLVTFIPRILKQYGGTFGAPKEEFHVVTVSSLGGLEAGPGTGPYSAAKAAVINLTYSFAEVLPAYGGHATVLCPWNINTNIGNAELYRPEELRNTGYNVNEKTVAMLRTVHALGQSPIDLAEVLKQRIEEDRVLVFPFHTIEEV